jgi:hypothetical protein
MLPILQILEAQHAAECEVCRAVNSPRAGDGPRPSDPGASAADKPIGGIGALWPRLGADLTSRRPWIGSRA